VVLSHLKGDIRIKRDVAVGLGILGLFCLFLLIYGWMTIPDPVIGVIGTIFILFFFGFMVVYLRRD